MTDLPAASNPIRESVLAAALRIRQSTPETLLPAMHDAAAALEFHLDSLVNELRAGREPRLLERARAVEEKLRAALLVCWEIERDLRAGPIDEARLREATTLLQDVGSDEIDLVYEELRDSPAMD